MSYDASKPLRAKKGDLFVKLQFEQGDSITVLVQKQDIKAHHQKAMKKLAAVLTQEMFLRENAKP